MPSFGMLSRVAVVRTDVSEERSTIIRVTRIGELGTLAVLISIQTPWPVVRKRAVPTERPPLDEIYCQLLRIEGCVAVSVEDPPRSLISVF
jgi:hypothetical protein